MGINTSLVFGCDRSECGVSMQFNDKDAAFRKGWVVLHDLDMVVGEKSHRADDRTHAVKFDEKCFCCKDCFMRFIGKALDTIPSIEKPVEPSVPVGSHFPVQEFE